MKTGKDKNVIDSTNENYIKEIVVRIISDWDISYMIIYEYSIFQKAHIQGLSRKKPLL